jgi:hypothetical protein
MFVVTGVSQQLQTICAPITLANFLLNHNNMTYAETFFSLHVFYAVLLTIIFGFTVKNYQGARMLPFAVMVAGLVYDNLLRAISSLMLRQYDEDSPKIALYKNYFYVSFILHHTTPALSLISGGRLIESFRWRTALDAVSVILTIVGIIDLFVEEIYQKLTVISNYGMTLIRSTSTGPPVVLIIIIIVNIIWIGLAFRFARMYRNWLPFALLALVLIWNAALTPPGIGQPENPFNFFKTVSSNGLEVVFAFGIYLLVTFRKKVVEDEV